MITDPLFYRLFEKSPETFFLLLGMPVEIARATALRYQFKAIEFKETSHRADGVFLPKEQGLPLYFWKCSSTTFRAYLQTCVSRPTPI